MLASSLLSPLSPHCRAVQPYIFPCELKLARLNHDTSHFVSEGERERVREREIGRDRVVERQRDGRKEGATD